MGPNDKRMLSAPERFAGHLLRIGTRLRRRWIDTSVGRVHVVEGHGRGKTPVVLLHGLSANAISYGDLIRRILPNCGRFVAPEMPGHGYSDVPRGGLTSEAMTIAMQEALSQLIVEPSIVVGNSMGGMAAVRMANLRPDLVRGLVLVSPGGAMLDQEGLDTLMDAFRMGTHRKAVEFIDRIFARPPGLARHALAVGVRNRFSSPVMRGFIDSIRTDDLLDPAELRSLHMPTLMIWGRQERLLPSSSLGFFREHLPDHADIEVWDEFGHIGFAERPAALARRLALFDVRLRGATRPLGGHLAGALAGALAPQPA
jgi:pimeloyl-ACP methyl ester carboxylesterase